MSVELNRELRFGSQLFINPEDTADLLRQRVVILHRAGFTLIRLFLAWNQIEPKCGLFQWSPYDDIFDEAQKHGMKIIGTLMSGSPPGWMRLTHGHSDVADLDDPEFFALSLSHVRKVVEHYRDSPALDSWILWNEPGRSLSPEHQHTQHAFQRYLEELYKGDIAAYNAKHYRTVRSFAEIETRASDLGQTGFISHHSKVEWLSFTIANLQEKLAAIAVEVKKLDSNHPIHVNPHRVSQCLADGGQSIWQEASLVDFMGCSAHPSWHSVRFPRERFSTSLGMFGDLTRSATKAENEYFWITELQGGVTLRSSFFPLTTTPAEARLWLWECIATGTKAVVYWCANARSDGYEAGEWDLLDVNGNPSPQLEMISETIHSLRAHCEILKEARPPVPDVGILVSEEGQILDLVEGEGNAPKNPRNVQCSSDAVSGAYLMAADLSLEVKFYDLKRFVETPVEKLPQVLLAPSLTVVTPKAIDQMRAAVQSGKMLMADGFFSWKDSYGRLARSTWHQADSLFGVEWLGYEAVAEDNFTTKNGAKLPGFFVRARLKPTIASEVARWRDGTPAVSINQIGKGTACRMGTQLFQHYFLFAEPNVRNWIWDMMVPHVTSELRLVNQVQGLRLRRLQYKDQEVAILINSTDRQQSVKMHIKTDVRDCVVPAQDAILIANTI
ncbi:MAG: beta-galactosidase [Methylacidiphilales bacterium]|nr:beta-galactosidase [Candidatus Methylacidiphilales bacterium]